MNQSPLLPLPHAGEGWGEGSRARAAWRRMRCAAVSAAVLLAARGPSEPRFGVLTVSATAPRASLTGHTSATGAPAIELSPGCPGFVDPGVPEHLVRLADASAVTITARSSRG